MPLKPRPKLKGIPIGGSFKASDKGKVVKAKSHAKLSPHAQYASKNKRRWKPAK